MTAARNDHGWGAPIGATRDGAQVSVAPVVEAHLRCTCPALCIRRATQEDLRCDECRETCR